MGVALGSLGVGAGAVALALGPDHNLYAACYGSGSDPALQRVHW